MTNFLPAGIINDRLQELLEAAEKLRQGLDDSDQKDELKNQARVVQSLALELHDFLSTFSCQPLIYTGKGTTEEVIDRLEWVLTFSDLPQLPAIKRKRGRPRKRLIEDAMDPNNG
ncbi:MAG: hypothetical protein ACM3MK_11240 [Chitinophagales bacterium]